MDCATQKFSSTACLLRHEREAHGLHGHGDKPYPCHFMDCDRSLPGQGFPRQWNLRDHMKRVHHYSPPNSPPSDYPSPPISHCSTEGIAPHHHRKRSPASLTGTKRPKGVVPIQSAKKETSAPDADPQLEQHMKLKAYIDRTYTNLDQRDTEAFERYHADLAQLQSLARNIRRKDAHRRAY